VSWWGWRRSDKGHALHIGELPGRKQIAIYCLNGANLQPLGYFVSVEAAEKARDMLDELIPTQGDSE
jgi:hypothetical protein